MFKGVAQLLFVLVLLFTFSCKNKKNDIGVDILPSGDPINSLQNDTTTIRAQTLLDDSLATDELGVTYIGSYNDPVFGTVNSSAFFQFLFPNNIVNVSLDTVTFGSPQFDSIVLSMPYNSGSYYGTLEQQTFKVYHLTQDMYRDSVYYSYRKLGYDSITPLGSLTFVPKPTDKVILGTDTTEPAIRIKLDNTFGQNLMNQYGKLAFTNSTELAKYLKGVYVKPENGVQSASTGAMLAINSASDKIKLIIYHRIKTKNLSADSNITLTMVVNSSSARFTHFEHDFSLATTNEVLTQLNTPGTNYEKIYLQGMAGLRAKITLPHIENWNNNMQIGLNKAEVILKVDPTNGSSLSTPAKLSLKYIDSNGNALDLDDKSEGEKYFDGNYNSSTQEYHFNITRHAQQILSGQKPNNGLYLFIDGNDQYPHRVILGNGTNSAGSALRLRLVYTNL